MLRRIMTSQDDKARGIDFEEMVAALRRAAYKAVHGTREERSGRFLRAESQDLQPKAPVEKQPGSESRKGLKSEKED
jgi:hypothetical protein